MLTHQEADSYIDAVCELAERFSPATQWQPAANDPDDEAIIQLALEAEVVYLVTHNVPMSAAPRNSEFESSARLNSWKS